MTIETLSNREKTVLKYIVENYVKFAAPVGSRSISKQSELNLSAATIRNIMSDLEDLDLINTPHTSAGRIPTDRGYRYYVDSLMQDTINDKDFEILKRQLDEARTGNKDGDDLYRETSKILGKISHQLAVVTQPFLNSGKLKKLEIINISSNKVLVVLTIEAGFVKTVVLDIDSEISNEHAERLSRYLNEKLSGLSLKQIRETFAERIKDYDNKENGLFQLFINSADKIYSESDSSSRIFFSGTGEVIMQPEFGDAVSLKKLIDVTEDHNVVIHIFNAPKNENEKVTIKIGEENENEKLKDYSIVCSSYNIGEIQGNIGIIGPKRLDYSKMAALIKYTSELISGLK